MSAHPDTSVLAAGQSSTPGLLSRFGPSLGTSRHVGSNQLPTLQQNRAVLAATGSTTPSLRVSPADRVHLSPDIRQLQLASDCSGCRQQPCPNTSDYGETCRAAVRLTGEGGQRTTQIAAQGLEPNSALQAAAGGAERTHSAAPSRAELRPGRDHLGEGPGRGLRVPGRCVAATRGPSLAGTLPVRVSPLV